eukprot:SAG31_NODE_37388_length_304_cov_1.604878_2_plen_54_part_01
MKIRPGKMSPLATKPLPAVHAGQEPLVCGGGGDDDEHVVIIGVSRQMPEHLLDG